MFSKGWTKIIILLFLVMLVPLLLDSFGIDIIEGAGPKSGSSLGGVGMKAAVGKAAQDAAKAKAALEAKKANSKAGTAAAPAATATATATAAAAAEEAEEDREIDELFTVNNDNGLDYAYALDVYESFTEGATAGKQPGICKIMNNRWFPIINNTKTSDRQKIDALKIKFDKIYKKKKCTSVMK